MIGCDNEDCQIDWFHRPCVNLSATDRPRGKWYCPRCRMYAGPGDKDGDSKKLNPDAPKRRECTVRHCERPRTSIELALPPLSALAGPAPTLQTRKAGSVAYGGGGACQTVAVLPPCLMASTRPLLFRIPPCRCCLRLRQWSCRGGGGCPTAR